VTGLIAGLGVGGLALALAAQKSIENLFGGVSLIADQAVRVGDFCKFGDGQIGTIEEIGLRSTRLRTVDRTLITIPNSDFSQRPLENFGARDQIRLLAILGLRYETEPDQLRWILSALRRELIRHPRVAHEDSRARFVAFGASSLDVEVAAYIKTTEWTEFLAVREDLYLRFIEIVREGGSGLAFPSQTVYLSRDARPDTERATHVVAEVQRWREEGRLPFPELPSDEIAQIAGSGDYPARGSAEGRSDPQRDRR
jgi:MscS family membrane protein